MWMAVCWPFLSLHFLSSSEKPLCCCSCHEEMVCSSCQHRVGSWCGPDTQWALCVHQARWEPLQALQRECLEGLWGSHSRGSRCLENASVLQGQVAPGCGSGSLDQVGLGEALLRAVMRGLLPT